MIFTNEFQHRIFDYCCNVIDVHGKKDQTVKAAEELNELSDTMLKAYSGRIDKDKILEEFADVVVMLFQIKMMYGLTGDEIKSWMIYKMDRELHRINGK